MKRRFIIFVLAFISLICIELLRRWRRRRRRRTRRTNMCSGQSSNEHHTKRPLLRNGTSSFLLKYGKWEVELWTVVSSYYIVMQLNKWNWNRRVQSKHTHTHTRFAFLHIFIYVSISVSIHPSLLFFYSIPLALRVYPFCACSMLTTLHFLDPYVSLCASASVFAITHPIRSYRYAWISI